MDRRAALKKLAAGSAGVSGASAVVSQPVFASGSTDCIAEIAEPYPYLQLKARRGASGSWSLSILTFRVTNPTCSCTPGVPAPIRYSNAWNAAGGVTGRANWKTRPWGAVRR